MIYFLVAIFSLLFVFLCWRDLQWGLYLVIACLPAYGVRFSLGPLPLTLLEAMIVILFVVWLIKAYQKEDLRPQSKFMGVAIVVLVVSLVTMLLAPDLRRAAGIWKAYFLEAFLFFVVFSGLVKNKEEIKRIIIILGVPALYISIFAIIQKLNDGWMVPYQYWYLGEGPRVTSFFSYPNALGLFVAPIVMLFFGYLVFTFQRKSWSAIIYSSAIIITGLLAIAWARSEGALIGLMVGLTVFGLLFKKARWIIVGAIILIVIVLLLTGTAMPLWQKITFGDWSGQVRLSMWSESWELIQDNWFWGAGLTGYQQALEPYHQAKHLEIFLYPHNFIFNFWVELGLIGLLAFLYMAIKYFYYGLKIKLQSRLSRRILAKSLLAVMVVILVHGLVDVPYFKNDLAVLWWVFIGLMSGLVNNN